MSPTAIRFLKSAFLVATDGLAGLQEFAGNATGLYYTTDEAHEGSQAFLAKRPARLPQVPAAPLMTQRNAAERRRRRAPVRRLDLGPCRPAEHAARRRSRRGRRPRRGAGRRARRSGSTLRSACLAVALLLQVVAELRERPVRLPARRRHRGRQGPLRVAAAGLVTERQLEVAIAIMIGLAGVVGLWLVAVGGMGAAAARRAGGRGRARVHRAGRSRTATGRWARCSCSSSSASWRWPGRRTCRPSSSTPLFVAAAIPPGALITAILVVNNLRDIPTDTAAGKRTLAVVLGERARRREYGAAARGRVRGAGAARVAWTVGRVADGGRRSSRCRVRRAAAAHPADGAPAAREGPRVRRAAGAQSRPEGDRAALAVVRAAVRPWARARGQFGGGGVTRRDGDRPGPRPVPRAVRDRRRDVDGARLVAGPRQEEDGAVGLGRGGPRRPGRRGSRRCLEALLDGSGPRGTCPPHRSSRTGVPRARAAAAPPSREPPGQAGADARLRTPRGIGVNALVDGDSTASVAADGGRGSRGRRVPDAQAQGRADGDRGRAGRAASRRFAPRWATRSTLRLDVERHMGPRDGASERLRALETAIGHPVRGAATRGRRPGGAGALRRRVADPGRRRRGGGVRGGRARCCWSHDAADVLVVKPGAGRRARWRWRGSRPARRRPRHPGGDHLAVRDGVGLAAALAVRGRAPGRRRLARRRAGPRPRDRGPARGRPARPRRS